MPGKISLYNLGSAGVDLTKSPIHKDDGSLVSAQNAVPDIRDEAGALTKRDGLVAINGTALAGGSVQGVVYAALAVGGTGSSTHTFYISCDDDLWLRSTDDFVSFTQVSTPDIPVTASNFSVIGADFGRMITVDNNRIIYPSNNYTVITDAPPIHEWNGTTERELCKIPADASTGLHALAVVDMLLVGSKIYLTVSDSGASEEPGRVFEMDLHTAALRQLGERFGTGSGELGGGTPRALGYVGGFLYVATLDQNGTGASPRERIYRMRPSIDTAWATDHTMTGATQFYPSSIVGFRGAAYCACAQTVLVRSTTNTWAVSANAAVTNADEWGALIVFNDNLYGALRIDPGATEAVYIYKFDGTTWTSVHTVDADASSNPWGGLSSMVYNGTLYFAVGGVRAASADAGFRIVSSTDGTTWSNLYTDDGTFGDIGERFGVVET